MNLSAYQNIFTKLINIQINNQEILFKSSLQSYKLSKINKFIEYPNNFRNFVF